MNSIEKELNGYMEESEKFSGFDSYDSADGEGDSYFDGDEMSYADAHNVPQAVSDPYVIQFQNTTTATVTAILFGYNLYANGGTNYGNNVAAVITNLQNATVGYGGLFNQSAVKNFKIGKWRFQSTTAAQLQQTLSINHIDGNGKQYSVPLNLSIMVDAYQYQSTVLDVTKPVTVDANTYISFPLLGSSTIVISMFPVSILSGKAELNGGHQLNTAKAPRLSGKNVAPVIIQTSQSVQGINKG